MHRSRHSNQLPEWLWFFLVLPIGLFVLVLIKRRQVQELALRLAASRRPRYVEPDSIPIEQHVPLAELPLEGEDAAQTLEPADQGYPAGQPADEGYPRPVDHEPEEQNLAAPAVQAAQEAQSGAPDDLKRIEGIGPAIDGLLAAQGIRTFRQLADTPLERLDQILTEAKLRRLADPSTWAEQAALAAEGRWDDLQTLQNSLSGGRRK